MIFRVRDQEGGWQHSATREEPPLTVTREEPEQQRRPSTAKNKNKQTKKRGGIFLTVKKLFCILLVVVDTWTYKCDKLYRTKHTHGRGYGNPPLPGESHGQRNLVAAIHGVTRSQTRLSDFTFTFTFMHWRRKWQPTPVFLPGESQGQRSLVGGHLWVVQS